jgi:uncharacterized protein (TIGR02246 family)
MRTKSILTFFMFIALMSCLYTVPSASAASAEEEVLQVMTNWYKAYNTMDLKLMSSLYWHSPKYSNFGPLSNPFLTQGWEITAKTWEETFTLPAGTFVLTSHNTQVTMLGDNVAIFTGYTNATVNPPVVKEQSSYQVRETNVLQKIDGKWLIVHSHASFFPAEYLS